MRCKQHFFLFSNKQSTIQRSLSEYKFKINVTNKNSRAITNITSAGGTCAYRAIKECDAQQERQN
jgi:hypothetical protein